MKTANLIVAVFCGLLLTASADAGRRGYSGGCSGGGCSGGNCGVPQAMPVSNCPGGICPAPGATVIAPATDCPNGNCAALVPTTPKVATDAPKSPAASPKAIAPATDPLSQVNARRAAAGLRPYVQDPGLTRAAQAAVQYRARLRIRGHVQSGMGDFQFLPTGATAAAAGADWYGATAEFATCAMTDNYTFAGAASAVGPDGEWYHQLFVR